MNIWIDCEFNSFRGALISIALVSEDGKEFYMALHRSEREAMGLVPWVAEHVEPVIFAPGASPLLGAKCEIQFEMALWLIQFESVHLVADWPADIGHFCDLMLCDDPGTRIATPPLTMEIVRIDGGSEHPHNALCDARGLRDKYLEAA